MVKELSKKVSDPAWHRPELADTLFEEDTKKYMRLLYARARKIMQEVTGELRDARKNGEPIGYLVKRQREAHRYMMLLEERGRRRVMLTPCDKHDMKRYFKREDFTFNFQIQIIFSFNSNLIRYL
jgi:hypothetical protein